MTLTPSPLSNAAIAEYAERVAEAHGEYVSGNRVDLDRLVGRLGGRIQTSLDIPARASSRARGTGASERG